MINRAIPFLTESIGTMPARILAQQWHITVAVIALVLLATNSVSALKGPNICTKTENELVEYEVKIPKPYEVRTLGWCLKFPPRCPKIRIAYRTETEKKVKNRTKVVESCCQGYTEIGDRCQPICQNQCTHGRCVAPDTCECTPGWGGPNCDKSCPNQQFGPNCENECVCRNGAKCDPFTGGCTCPPGWIGVDCDQPCPNNSFGHNCNEICQCENGDCSHVNGVCTCHPGFTGSLCDTKCPEGKHGQNCSNACRCQNNGTCYHVTGECLCAPGWTGEACTESCSLSGRWGQNCSEICECYNGGVCHHVTGECQCQPGYTGANCENQCPDGKYGPGCKLSCDCQNDAGCNRTTGACICTKGYSGKFCENRDCPPGKYGYDRCDQTCQCYSNNTLRCDPFDGSCKCKPGFRDLCHKQCPPPYYGQDCKQICGCQPNGMCHHVTGDCICNAGWTGDKCDKPCFAGTYGIGCAQKCMCFGNVKCNPETGRCDCPPGFSGLKCNRPCAKHRFGEKCSFDCRCKNGAACNPVNGTCSCLPGYTGTDCSRKCSDGWFGLNCKYRCDCDERNSGSCDPVTGECRCLEGWHGQRCQHRKQCPEGNYSPPDCQSRCDCRGPDLSTRTMSCSADGSECFCPLGLTGNRCHKSCRPGSFGKSCIQDCPLCMHSNQTCDQVNGSCSCLPGYTGFFCEQVCPDGMYGPGCKYKCECSKIGGQCDHETGKCICYPGWKGVHCSEPCQEGSYGLECQQRCKCLNGAKCRQTDGICFCPPGYMGTYCSETCPDGFFGQNCLTSCFCPKGNYICDPVRGCICKYGFEGPDCTTTIVLAASQEMKASNSSGMSAWIFLSLLVLMIIGVAAGFHYRRKFFQFKELLYVQYMSRPSAETRHFDNPVYASGLAGGSGNESSSPASVGLGSSRSLLNNSYCNMPLPAPSSAATAKNCNLKASFQHNDFGGDEKSYTSNGNEYELPGNNLYSCIDDEHDKLSSKLNNFYHTIDECDRSTKKVLHDKRSMKSFNNPNHLASGSTNKAQMNDYDIPRSSKPGLTKPTPPLIHTSPLPPNPPGTSSGQYQNVTVPDAAEQPSLRTID